MHEVICMIMSAANGAALSSAQTIPRSLIAAIEKDSRRRDDFIPFSDLREDPRNGE